MHGPRRFLCAVAVGLLALTGCQATATVAIDVNDDASGTVSVTLVLDEQAAGQIGTDVAAALKLDDLRESGWSIDGPTTTDGETVVSIEKPFAGPAQLPPIIEEISGPDGPLQDVSLTTANGFGSADYRFRGRVRLTGDLAQFSDADITSALDGLAVGRTPEELATAFGDDPDALTLRLSVELPGDTSEVRGFRDGDAAVVSSFPVGQGEPVDQGLVVASTLGDRSALVWIVGGVAALALALVLLRPRGIRAR